MASNELSPSDKEWVKKEVKEEFDPIPSTLDDEFLREWTETENIKLDFKEPKESISDSPTQLEDEWLKEMV